MDMKKNPKKAASKSQSPGITLPRRTSSNLKRETLPDAVLENSAEKVLCDILFAIKASILKACASKGPTTDLERILPFLPQRSRESVEQEVSKIIVKLVDMRGPNPNHRMVAYSNVGEQLISEIDGLLNNTDAQKLVKLEKKHDDLKEEKERLHQDLSQEVATRDIKIARLMDQQFALEDKLQSMCQANTGLQLELEKLLRDRIQTHQNSVELRMQGLDFKAEVDRRSGNILASVQARMGFVPVGIEKQVELLRALKAPGDPSYDRVRQFRAMKMPTVDAESFVSGLGSGSDISLGNRNKKSPRRSLVNGGSSPLNRPSSLTSSIVDEDWPPSQPPLSSPIRSKNLTPTASINMQSNGSSIKSDKTARPSSAPARRSSPSENGSNSKLQASSPIISPRDFVSSPHLSSQSTYGSKFSSGESGAAALVADSASIVRKIRSRNLDSRNSSGKCKASPTSGSGVTFNSLIGTVVKSGSPVRGSIEAKRDIDQAFDEQPTVTIPTAPLRYSDEDTTSSADYIVKSGDVRERRSSSGATSTATSSVGAFL